MKITRPWIVLILILGSFVSGGFILNFQADDSFPMAMPGTFPLKEESDAVAVGRTVALGHLVEGVRARDVKLISVQLTGAAELVATMNTEGSYPDDSFAQALDGVWLVTFTGSFSPKHYGRDNPPVFHTMTIILNAQDGGVAGVEMRDKQR